MRTAAQPWAATRGLECVGVPLPQRLPVVPQALRRELVAIDALEHHGGFLSPSTASWSGLSPPLTAPAIAPAIVRQRRQRRLVRASAEAGVSRQQESTPPLLEQQQQGPPQRGRRQLSANEQRQLAIAAGAGDQRAVQLLVDTNRPLVHFLAKRFVGKGLAREDLVSEGILALERAARQFKLQPGREARFSTFAAATICNGMSRALCKQSRDIRLPAHHYRDMGRVQHATLQLATERSGQPTYAEVAQRCGFTVSYTMHLLRAMAGQSNRPAPLHSGLDESKADDYSKLTAVSVDVSAEGLDVLLEDEIAAEEYSQLVEADLRSCLAKLDPKQVRVFELRHGLDGNGQLRTWNEVGKCMGRSGSWASTQYSVAERKMQAFLRGSEHQQPGSNSPRQHSTQRSGSNSGSNSSSSSRRRGSSGDRRSSEARPAMVDLETRAEMMAGIPQPVVVDAAEAVADALASLKPNEQVVMALRLGWLDGTSEVMLFKHVAARMKRTFNGANNLYKRAESALKARLEALGHGNLDLTQLRYSQQQRETWQRQLEALPTKPSRRGLGVKPSQGGATTGKASGKALGKASAKALAKKLEASSSQEAGTSPAQMAAGGDGTQGELQSVAVEQQQSSQEEVRPRAARSPTRLPFSEASRQAPTVARVAGSPGPSGSKAAGSPFGHVVQPGMLQAEPAVLSNGVVPTPASWPPHMAAAPSRSAAASRQVLSQRPLKAQAAERRVLAAR